MKQRAIDNYLQCEFLFITLSNTLENFSVDSNTKWLLCDLIVVGNWMSFSSERTILRPDELHFALLVSSRGLVSHIRHGWVTVIIGGARCQNLQGKQRCLEHRILLCKNYSADSTISPVILRCPSKSKISENIEDFIIHTPIELRLTEFSTSKEALL